MSDAPAPLGPDALDLLLTVLELPTTTLSARTVTELHPEAAAVLQEQGLLHADGHEEALATPAGDDDLPVAAVWSPEGDGYGVFSAQAGWVAIPADRLTRYAVKPTDVMTRCTGALRCTPGAVPDPIVPDLAWDLGPVRLPGRVHLVSLWFVRRLFDPTVWLQVKEACRARPPDPQRIILTSTATPRLTDRQMSRHLILSLHDVLQPGGNLAVAPEALTMRLDGTSMAVPGDGLQVFADGREVHLHGAKYEFPRGDMQRRVIMLLHTAYLDGEIKLPTARVIAELDFDPKARLRDLFKGHPAWGRLLHEQGGVCGFCLGSPGAIPAA